MTENRKKIILADSDIANLSAGKKALAPLYDVFTVPTGQKLLTLLEKVTPDLILLDMDMEGMSGFDIMKILNKKQQTTNIPVIMILEHSQLSRAQEGLEHGAVDYVAKPFVIPMMLKRVEVHILLEAQKAELQNYNANLQEMIVTRTKTILDLQNAVITTVAELVECRDDITGGHIERTQSYINILIGEMLRKRAYADIVSSWNLEFLIQSAQLHDVGKIAIKDSILQKPGKLTQEEFEAMKQHAIFGVKIIERIQKNTNENAFLKHAKIFAGTHHEKWDGSGYPYGLKGEEIPLQGRIMAVADVYDALISERPYKKAFTHEEAVNIIVEGKGAHFDPVMVDIFLGVADKVAESAIAAGKAPSQSIFV